jgi:general secretion pathway protein D
VVIGGLIDDSTTINKTKVPGLSDVPVLGWLFRKKSESNEKTNLYIFLTPRVIKSPAEAEVILKDKQEHINEIGEGRIKLYEKNAPLPTE